MKLALMQPYLFPYLGYFQLISACDTFVVHDDVQYIKGGWINRNRIGMNGRDHLFTLSVASAPSSALINERTFSSQHRAEVAKLRRVLEAAYRKAPHFSSTMDIVDEVFASEDIGVSRVATRSLALVCKRLGIERRWLLSSELAKNDTLKGQDRVLEIARVLGATGYMNAIGGLELYERAAFIERGIAIDFLRMRFVPYAQLSPTFVPGLSILDVLMFNSLDRTRELLTEYDLV